MAGEVEHRQKPRILSEQAQLWAGGEGGGADKPFTVAEA